MEGKNRHLKEKDYKRPSLKYILLLLPVLKWEGKVAQSCLTFCDPMNCSPPGSSVHGDSPGKNTGVGNCSLLQRIFATQVCEPRSPALQADSLPAEPQEKPKNTGVGSLSLLQQIFPTQELNQGLLHWRWILYQLSYQGSSYI